MTRRVYVSIGSNIERERNVRSAVAMLREHFGPLAISPVYETEAVGFAGDPFYNLVVGFDTEQPPQSLVARFRAIESAHGREHGPKKFAARTLDIDLLTWGDATLNEQGLNLPREEIVRYAFVLGPLADLAPQERHPRCGRRYGDLWADLAPADCTLRRVELNLADAGAS